MEQADFIAWSLYTGPSNIQSLFEEGSDWIVGQWDGVNEYTAQEEVPEQIKIDINCRISAVIEAFKKALGLFSTNDRYFVIPEFFFHCKEGPYPYVKIERENGKEKKDCYPFEYIVSTLKEKLQECIPEDNNDYTIIVGSALTSNVVNYNAFLGSDRVIERQRKLNRIIKAHDIYKIFLDHDFSIWSRGFSTIKNPSEPLRDLNKFMYESRRNPLCTVRSRGVFFHFNKQFTDGVESFVYEKQNESSVDLTMGMFNHEGKHKGKITHNNMITEWLCNYPAYTLYFGDKQTTPWSTNARFSSGVYGKNDIGVEICLDHYYQRLRRTVGMKSGDDKWPGVDNYPLIKQFVPSGGEQLRDWGIAAHKNSVIFNADGCEQICYDTDNHGRILENGTSRFFKGITSGVYNQSIQSEWSGRDGHTYYSHSQLAFTTNDSIVKSYNNAEGREDTNKAKTYNVSAEKPYNKITDSYKVELCPCNLDKKKRIFAADDGELHHYSPR